LRLNAPKTIKTYIHSHIYVYTRKNVFKKKIINGASRENLVDFLTLKVVFEKTTMKRREIVLENLLVRIKTYVSYHIYSAIFQETKTRE